MCKDKFSVFVWLENFRLNFKFCHVRGYHILVKPWHPIILHVLKVGCNYLYTFEGLINILKDISLFRASSTGLFY